MRKSLIALLFYMMFLEIFLYGDDTTHKTQTYKLEKNDLKVQDPFENNFVSSVSNNLSTWLGTNTVPPYTKANTPIAPSDTTVFTYEQLADAMANPYNCPDPKDSAALVTLAHYLKQTKSNSNTDYTYNDLLALCTPDNSNYIWNIVLNDPTNLSNLISTYYSNQFQALVYLSDRNFPLYTNNLAPQTTQNRNGIIVPLFLKQNNIGDCYLVSAIGWLLTFDNGKITQTISENPSNSPSDAATLLPNTYTVKFPGYDQSITVNLTEAELLFYSGANSCGYTSVFGTLYDGVWAVVIQKAVGKYLASKSDTSTEKTPDTIEPLENLCIYQASAGEIQELFYTSKSKALYCKDSTADSMSKFISDGLNRKVMIQAMSSSKDNGYKGLILDHWHAVWNYDPSTSTLTLWNPWGDNGGGREMGIFNISMTDFLNSFDCVVIPQ